MTVTYPDLFTGKVIPDSKRVHDKHVLLPLCVQRFIFTWFGFDTDVVYSHVKGKVCTIKVYASMRV